MGAVYTSRGRATSLQLPLLLPRRVRGHNSLSLSLTHGLFLHYHHTKCLHSYWLRTHLLLTNYLTFKNTLWLLHDVRFLFMTLPCNMPLSCQVILVFYHNFFVVEPRYLDIARAGLIKSKVVTLSN